MTTANAQQYASAWQKLLDAEQAGPLTKLAVAAAEWLSEDDNLAMFQACKPAAGRGGAHGVCSWRCAIDVKSYEVCVASNKVGRYAAKGDAKKGTLPLTIGMRSAGEIVNPAVAKMFEESGADDWIEAERKSWERVRRKEGKGQTTSVALREQGVFIRNWQCVLRRLLLLLLLLLLLRSATVRPSAAMMTLTLQL
jgi:hypothetical protein